MANLVNTLHDATTRVRTDHPAVEPDAVADIARAPAVAMKDDMTAMQRSLFTEVAELGCALTAAREEIARLRREQDFGESPIPEATDALDAIVEHTAAATETILDACEHIDALAGDMGADEAASLQNQTIRIFEACSFQDITGQRISKVVAALKMVERRIERIVGTYAPGSRPDAAEVDVPDALLNGPQMPHAAMDQAAIDLLLTF